MEELRLWLYLSACAAKRRRPGNALLVQFDSFLGVVKASESLFVFWVRELGSVRWPAGAFTTRLLVTLVTLVAYPHGARVPAMFADGLTWCLHID